MAKKRKRKRNPVPTTAEVIRLIQSCRKSNMMNIRTRAAISTLWRAQLRIQELCDLRLFDIDLQQGRLRVASGKRGKERVCAINREGIPILKDWVRVREVTFPETGWFFCNNHGEQLTPATLRKSIMHKIRAAGLRHFTPHDLRHSGASHLLECDVNILTIQQQLGHSSVQQTWDYCHKLNPMRMLEELRDKAVF